MAFPHARGSSKMCSNPLVGQYNRSYVFQYLINVPPIFQGHDHDPVYVLVNVLLWLDGSIDLDVDVAVIPDRIG